MDQSNVPNPINNSIDIKSNETGSTNLLTSEPNILWNQANTSMEYSREHSVVILAIPKKEFQRRTTIPVTEPLPEGYQWGRHYDKYRPDPTELV